jgi:hypothetical protein
VAVHVRDAGELVAVLVDGLDVEALGALTGEPIVAVAIGNDEDSRRLGDLRALVPCVVVGVGRPGAAADGVDVALTTERDAPRPWISADTSGEAAACDELDRAVRASPAAAICLVQLLRMGEHLDPAGGLVAESLAYATLQSGPDFRSWLASREEQTTPASAAEGGPPVVATRDGREVTITLNRPEVHNAYSAAMRDALVAALDAVVADPEVRAHLRGAGRSFSSGGDLREFGEVPDPATGHLVRSSRSAAASLWRCRNRVTAHVHGACIGAGAELAAVAATVESTADASFSLPEVAMGLVPGAGGTVSIPARVGRHRAAWMALTGRAVDAGTALEWGLVDRLV